MYCCSTTLNTYFVYSYLTCLLSKRLAVPIQRTIQHWMDNHGIEWTVTRLKDLKAQYLSYLSGSDRTLVLSHKDGTPKGSFRPLWRKPSDVVLKVLGIYTTVVLSKITTKQEEKFLSSVSLRDWTLNYPIDTDGLRFSRDYFYGHPYNWISHKSRRAPAVNCTNSMRTVPEREVHFDDVLENFRNPHVASHVLRYRVEYAKALWIAPDTIVENCWSPDTLTSPSVWRDRPVGKIGLIQEKGAKLRAVANPFRHHQMVLQPLGDAVFDLLRSLSWDCTFDQRKGIQFVVDMLKSGHTVHSLDLSDATNSFPLKIQGEVLKAIITRTDTNTQPKVDEWYMDFDASVSNKEKPANLGVLVDIFLELSRLGWSYRNNRYIYWTKGQPLGLYPSFAIFALVHGLMVRNIERKLRKRNTFRILGDDIVIADDEVARCYREDMEYLGCTFSEKKCITSNVVAEFAGCVIGSEGVINEGKYRPFKEDDPLGPLHYLGIGGLKFLPTTLRKRLALSASAPEPVGLGLNPKGYDLDSRMPPEIINWWYPLKKRIPNETKISYADALHMHKLFWSSLEWVLYLNKWELIQTSPTPVPPDRMELSSDQLIVDHVKAVNSSMVFQDDIQLPVPIGPQTPNRGRNREDNGTLRTGINRALKYAKLLKSRLR